MFFKANNLLYPLDEAMNSVLDHLGHLRQKEIQNILNEEIIERILIF